MYGGLWGRRALSWMPFMRTGSSPQLVSRCAIAMIAAA